MLLEYNKIIYHFSTRSETFNLKRAPLKKRFKNINNPLEKQVKFAPDRNPRTYCSSRDLEIPWRREWFLYFLSGMTMRPTCSGWTATSQQMKYFYFWIIQMDLNYMQVLLFFQLQFSADFTSIASDA